MNVLVNWYRIIYQNFLQNLDCLSIYPAEFDKEFPYYKFNGLPEYSKTMTKYRALFFDQEPIYINLMTKMLDNFKFHIKHKSLLFFSTEISKDKDIVVEKYKMNDVYYFYHAIAAQEMYLDGFYLNQDFNLNFDKVFISYNNLINNNRVYRSDFVARLYEKNLINEGYLSYNTNGNNSILEDIGFPLLPTSSKEIILKNIDDLNKKLIIDHEVVTGAMSSSSGLENNLRAFVHVVTETIFYEQKLHLTEKIFKPIVSKQPFLLLAAPGNLEYLKGYGFKTFSDFWDEGYDKIINPAKRIEAVVAILESLAGKSHCELVAMKSAMRDILEHNHYHFYHTLRPMVVTELTDNMAKGLASAEIPYNTNDLQHLNQILCY